MYDTAHVPAARALVMGAQALSLATVDADGRPDASYVPFAVIDGRVTIAVSTLAVHARNLAMRPRAELLFVAAPDTDKNTYSLPRLMLDAHVERIVSSGKVVTAWDALAARHGETVTVLRTLTDFSIYECQPSAGRAVLGFAMAYDLDVAALTPSLRGATA